MPVITRLGLIRWSRRIAGGPTTFVQTNTGSITPAGALQNKVFHAVAGSIAPAGALVKKAEVAFEGTITPASTLVNTEVSLHYPDADVAATGWDTAPTASQSLFAQLDEVAVPSDTDYIFPG